MDISNSKGFTLIELIMVIVILGLISAVAVVKYQPIDIEAKKSSCRDALGSIRSGISIYQASKALKEGNALWPELDSLATIGVVMIHEIPKNPFQNEANAPDSIVEGYTRGVVVGTRGGWAYKPSTGEFWPNTSTTILGSGCQGQTVIGENNW